MFVFIFDRIYTGAPNITGEIDTGAVFRYAYYAGLNGCYYTKYQPNDFASGSGHKSWRGVQPNFDSSRISKEYNSTTEIRVKSLICKALLKLF